MKTVDIVDVLKSSDASGVECGSDCSALRVIGSDHAEFFMHVVLLGDVDDRVYLLGILQKASACPRSNHVTQTYLPAGAKPLFLTFAYVNEEHARVVLNCV